MKKLLHPAAPDRSQRVRRAVQGAFAALNVLLGVQFYRWVRYFERGGTGLYMPRPPGVEGWLPIAGYMDWRYLRQTGHAPAVHPAALFLFMAFVLMSLVFKKAFCTWLCPIGALSEGLWKLGRRVLGRNFRLPGWADVPLRGLKYLLLAFFLMMIGGMTADAIASFMSQPYGLMVDVRMLNFFRHLGPFAAATLAVLGVLSLLVQDFWCRYLCPYGALMGLASLLSPLKIRRDADACIDCAKCAKACPAGLPVDRLAQVSSAECAACLSCVAACPARDALQFSLPPRRAAEPAARWAGRRLPALALAGALGGVLVAFILVAKATGHWRTDLPRDTYLQLVPRASDLADQEAMP